jgi:hypothetical protein
VKQIPLVIDGNATPILGHVTLTHPVAPENMALYADKMMIVPIYKRTVQGNEIVAFSVQVHPEAKFGWK